MAGDDISVTSWETILPGVKRFSNLVQNRGYNTTCAKSR